MERGQTSGQEVFSSAYNKTKAVMSAQPLLEVYSNNTNSCWVGDFPPSPWLDQFNVTPYVPYVPVIQTLPVDSKAWEPKDWIEFIKEIKKLEIDVPNKLSKEMVSSQFPPSNMYVTDDGDLTVEVVVAGYVTNNNTGNIAVKIEDEHLVITGKEQKNTVKKYYMQKGLKNSDFEIRFFIDRNEFCLNDSKASYNDGLLKITFKKQVKESMNQTIEISFV